MKNKHDETYHAFLEKILREGTFKGDRTGTGTQSIFGHSMTFDMEDGFPLITTKRVHFKSIAIELLWFLRGDTNIKFLKENGVSIWDEWADENGNLGPVYGSQWRSWPAIRIDVQDSSTASLRQVYIDQIQQVVEGLRANPDGRRHIVSAWNVAEIPYMKLPPCHAFFQFYSRPTEHGRYLDVQLYQRSADAFLGVPFNIASYALLLHMMAMVTGHKPGRLIWTGGDCHIYDNHRTQVFHQLARQPKEAPELGLQHRNEIDDFVYEDFILAGYDPHPGIKAPVAV